MTHPSPAPRRGLFITFEGGDGSGKTTQARALVRRLRRRGYSVLLFREPGGTPPGEAVRRLLKSAHTLSPAAEMFLFLAARAVLVSEQIGPALRQGRIVLCDRFAASTVAYQGYGRGLSRKLVEELNRLATGGLAPDLTVLLDIPPKVGLGRLVGRGDRFEREELAFHQRVRKGYLTLARESPQSWLVVDATRPAAEVGLEIWRHVEPLLTPQPRFRR